MNATMLLYPALVTCLALLVYVWNFMACGQARGKYGIEAPAVTGHPQFERQLRIQQNMVEQLVLFLPSLWIFCRVVNPLWGAILGLLFVIGRIVYSLSYARDPRTRGAGFMIAGISSLLLLIGGIVGTVQALIIIIS